uniref:Uncharacterized protein n=1 Tax=Vespula pensylvanica TaxID=30213 RepID=A0A834NQE2_VESPE|nr:hypothetical protein H0235_012123 [Vespula pensylvanica]
MGKSLRRGILSQCKSCSDYELKPRKQLVSLHSTWGNVPVVKRNGSGRSSIKVLSSLAAGGDAVATADTATLLVSVQDSFYVHENPLC